MLPKVLELLDLMYRSNIFCLFSIKALVEDTVISEIFLLSKIFCIFIFPQIFALRSKKKGDTN